jgi:hypothetical protein
VQRLGEPSGVADHGAVVAGKGPALAGVPPVAANQALISPDRADRGLFDLPSGGRDRASVLNLSALTFLTIMRRQGLFA